MRISSCIGISVLAVIGFSFALLGQTPAVNPILEHYVAALGGRTELEKVTSTVIRGSIEFPGLDATGTTVEYFKLPDHFAAITQAPGYGTVRTIYDGCDAWQVDPQNGISAITGAELADVRRRSDIHWNLKLAQFYPGLKVTARDADAWKLEATVDNWTYDFWFDVNSGLLVRFDTDRHRSGGSSSVKIGDYRRVGAVLFAFDAAMSSTSASWHRKLTDVKFNEAIDDAVFAKPSAAK